MDPTATLNLIYDADSPEEKAQHARDLLDWLAAGGFMPKDRDGDPLLMSRSQLQRYCRAVVKHPRWRGDPEPSPPSHPEVFWRHDGSRGPTWEER